MSSQDRSAVPAIDEASTDEAAPSNDGLMPSRMAIFVGVFSLILLLSTVFASVTFRHFTGITGWASLVLPPLLSLGFVPAMLLGFRRRHLLLTALYRVSATALAFLNFALIAALVCWLVAGIADLFQTSWDSRSLAFALYGLAAAITVYGLINAYWIRTTRITVALPNLPNSWQGRTVALVSDVHLGNVRGDAFVRRIVSRLNTLKPDAVLLAGDMFDGAEVDLATVAQSWGKLEAPQGVFFSTGNHDEFSDRSKFMTALNRAGVRILHNEKVELDGGLQLIGVHDDEAGDPDLFRKILGHAKIDRRRASILLTHQPSNLTIPEEAGVSLQVSGHTHGGQFWPWTHVVSRVHGRFAYGLNRLNALQVLTSSGVGTWGPPIRVGTRSEIVLLRLEAE
ncbi:MAG: metallophosphoesterase [Opitutaceae bacterium]|nr:metallophosphoesterase [Opitutaceae bacterium]